MTSEITGWKSNKKDVAWTAVEIGRIRPCVGSRHDCMVVDGLYQTWAITEWDIQVHLMSELLRKLNVAFVINMARVQAADEMSVSKCPRRSFPVETFKLAEQKQNEIIAQYIVKISNRIESLENLGTITRNCGNPWGKHTENKTTVSALEYLKLTAATCVSSGRHTTSS